MGSIKEGIDTLKKAYKNSKSLEQREAEMEAKTPGSKTYQSASGQADEMTAEKRGQRTGAQMNIGPNMGREDKAANQRIAKDADRYLSATKESVSSDIDSYNAGKNRAKAEAATGPEFKKGGSVKSKCACGGGKMAKGGMARSSASKRADGIAIRGKTRA